MRRYRTNAEPEPWIEQLIQNYGQSPSQSSVRAHVVGVSDLSESQRTDESDACMLFLSDGTAFIPAVLGAAAWEQLQELEEREAFSGLDNTTVSVQKYQLRFHMDPELTSCQFYLVIDRMITVGRVTRHFRPSSCTMLQSVRHQILKTWRSLTKDCSVGSLSSQSAFPLSCLMGAWHNDIIVDQLTDAVKKIASPSVCHQGVTTPTLWHQERLRCRGEACFSTPVSHLLIPEDQGELLTADPGSLGTSETLSGLVPPCVDLPENQPIPNQEQDIDLPSVAFERSDDEVLSIPEYMRPADGCSGGGESGGRGNPWDMFCPAPDLLKTPSSCSEISRDADTQSLFTEAPEAPQASSTQAQTPSTMETLGSIIPPYQHPHCFPHSPTPMSDKTSINPSDEQQRESHVSLLATFPPTHQSSQTRRKSPVSPPAKKGRVHADGSCFYYKYEPCQQIVSALSKFQVPEKFVQWAASYLAAPQHALTVGAGAAQRGCSV